MNQKRESREHPSHNSNLDRREFVGLLSATLFGAGAGVLSSLSSCGSVQSNSGGVDMMVPYPIDVLLPPKDYRDYIWVGVNKVVGIGAATDKFTALFKIANETVFILDDVKVNITYYKGLANADQRTLQLIRIIRPGDVPLLGPRLMICRLQMHGVINASLLKTPILFLPGSSFVIHWFCEETAICKQDYHMTIEGRVWADSQKKYPPGSPADTTGLTIDNTETIT